MIIYKIHAALHSEVRSGDIWTCEDFKCRLLKVKNLANNKNIVVSYRFIDENFKKTYNRENRITLEDNSIVLDSYYRNKLGLDKKQRTAELAITKAGYLAGLKYLVNHPNDSIRISTNLAIFSIIFGTLFGIISFIAGLIISS